MAQGIANRVVDSASIEVNRRARRAKTDRLDALKLVTMLVRVWAGERRVWSEVRVPTVADEAARQVSRERTALTQDQTRLVNQMRGWLATWGTTLPARRRGAGGRRCAIGPGRRCPPKCKRGWRARRRGCSGLEAQIAELEAQQQAAVTAAAPTTALRQLGAAQRRRDDECVGALDEGLVWRAFRNRRQIGGLLGFAPTPYNSGESAREQGISRAGNARLQAISIQLAWNWVRWQPQSALTQLVSGEFREGQTRAADRDRRGGPQTGDRALAVCHDRRRPGGRDLKAA